jgi:predicted esterase
MNPRNSQLVHLLIKGVLVPLIVWVLITVVESFGGGAPEGRLVEQPDSLVYFPTALATQKSSEQYFPLVVAFSPGGDAQSLIQFWKPLADKYQMVVYASKLYHNDMPAEELKAKSQAIYQSLITLTQNYPIETRRMIYTGLSGGGSFSYFMNYYYPNTAAALVVNTGRMWEDWVYNPIAANLPAAKARMSNPPVVIFLASPTDFRYPHMQRDKQLTDQLGWKSRWIEFTGGHTLAPYADYEQALDWLQAQPEWNPAFRR